MNELERVGSASQIEIRTPTDYQISKKWSTSFSDLRDLDTISLNSYSETFTTYTTQIAAWEETIFKLFEILFIQNIIVLNDNKCFASCFYGTCGCYCLCRDFYLGLWHFRNCPNIDSNKGLAKNHFPGLATAVKMSSLALASERDVRKGIKIREHIVYLTAYGSAVCPPLTYCSRELAASGTLAILSTSGIEQKRGEWVKSAKCSFTTYGLVFKLMLL